MSCSDKIARSDSFHYLFHFVIIAEERMAIA